MSFVKVIRGLNYKQLISLSGKFIKHPLFMISTITATAQTFTISQREFPDIHGKHNKANAFRHALWNILIAKKCTRFSKNIEVVLHWTQQITDWHEEFSPNEELAKEMDLHNNAMGRDLFLDVTKMTTLEITNTLKSRLNAAIKVDSVFAISDSNELVYLED